MIASSSIRKEIMYTSWYSITVPTDAYGINTIFTLASQERTTVTDTSFYRVGLSLAFYFSLTLYHHKPPGIHDSALPVFVANST